MKSITFSVDDEVYRKASREAARRDTSVSSLVKEFLIGLSEQEGELDRIKRQERALRATIASFSASDRLGREEIHERKG